MTAKTSMRVQVDLTIQAEPERVFTALTTGTAIWWGAPYLERKEATDLVLEPKVGGRFYERWNLTPGEGSGALLGSVVAIDPPRLLRMHGSFGMTERAVLGVVSIELSPFSEGTQVKFSHQATGDLDDELELHYAHGWHDLLGRLKFFVEEGAAEGVRFDPSLHSHF
jgi:uncharacterized protein YndB with AHSA1/START domain